jgi:Protein of unknown function (DUF1761)
MLRINYWAVVAAAIAAFVAGGVWHSPLLLGKPPAETHTMNPTALANGSSSRRESLSDAGTYPNLGVPFMVGRVVVRLGGDPWMSAIKIGRWVGVGFRALSLAGSVLHEGMPWTLCVIHAGALVKTILMTAALGV